MMLLRLARLAATREHSGRKMDHRLVKTAVQRFGKIKAASCRLWSEVKP
jgi:hypothetical protein